MFTTQENLPNPFWGYIFCAILCLGCGGTLGYFLFIPEEAPTNFSEIISSIEEYENTSDGWTFYLPNDSNAYHISTLATSYINFEALENLSQADTCQLIVEGNKIHAMSYGNQTIITEDEVLEANSFNMLLGKGASLFIAIFGIICFPLAFRAQKKHQKLKQMNEEEYTDYEIAKSIKSIKRFFWFGLFFPYFLFSLKWLEKGMDHNQSWDQIWTKPLTPLNDFQVEHWHFAVPLLIGLNILGAWAVWKKNLKKMSNKQDVIGKMSHYYNSVRNSMAVCLIGILALLFFYLFTGNWLISAVGILLIHAFQLTLLMPTEARMFAPELWEGFEVVDD